MFYDREFTRIVQRLECASVVWTKQGRKNMYVSEEIEIKNFNLSNPLKVIGLRSFGDTIAIRVKYIGGNVEYYYLYPEIANLTKTQKKHFFEWRDSFYDPWDARTCYRRFV